MTLILDQKAYMVKAPFSISYDVGREGIGLVSENFEEGQTVVGQLRDGKLRYLAVYTANGKHYNTPVYLDMSNFVETELVESEDNRMSMQDRTIMVMVALSITFAILISRQ